MAALMGNLQSMEEPLQGAQAASESNSQGAPAAMGWFLYTPGTEHTHGTCAEVLGELWGHGELLPGEGCCRSCVSSRRTSGQEESEVTQGEKVLGWRIQQGSNVGSPAAHRDSLQAAQQWAAAGQPESWASPQKTVKNKDN